MRYARLHYTRAARTRLQTLPPEVRLNLENHLENISELVMALPPERLLQFLARGEEGFVTAVEGVRVLFVVDATVRTLLIHRLEALPGDEREVSPAAP
jgi:hypothetical protein